VKARALRVGVLEILSLPAKRPGAALHDLIMSKQYASITPQAVAVWCRRLGCETHYATYYGLGDPSRYLPSELDVVFISSYTWASALAYGLSRLYRSRGALTVLGGPHAKAFPRDSLRFFDLVVGECDVTLIADILAGHHDPGSMISSQAPMDDVPSVEERMPEIRRASLFWGRQRSFTTAVPLLASVGCPYQCNFCIDWDNPYRLLSSERLAADLRYLSEHHPGIIIAFHDPNFGVTFEAIMTQLERIPPERRSPYVMESSLSNLRGARIERLGKTKCLVAAPGIESWQEYSNKAAAQGRRGEDKVRDIVEHFQKLYEHVPYLQANFIFGLDTDEGDSPVNLTKEFMNRTPFVWPTLNIPTPFGRTPLFDQLLSEGRVLTSMPFTFYDGSHLVMLPKNYDATTYFAKLADLADHSSSPEMLRKRIASSTKRSVKIVHWTRTSSNRAWTRSLRKTLERLGSDGELRAFHEGRSGTLPTFYHRLFEKRLGRFAALVEPHERVPLLERSEPTGPSDVVKIRPRVAAAS
jgi:hypothetical protein